MSEFKYYVFTETKFVHSCSQLLENILKKREQLLLLVNDVGYWDDALWLNPKDSFLSHSKYQDDENWDLAPIIITDKLEAHMPYEVIVSINTFQVTKAPMNVFIAESKHSNELKKLYTKYPGSLWPAGSLS